MRTPGVGCRTFLGLLKTHTPAQLFAESASALSALGLKSDIIHVIKNPDWTMIDYDLSWLEQKNNLVITFNDANYPLQLKEIADPPPILFVRGNPDLLALPQIAIVGSRNPSSLGEETAFNFAKTLSRHGFIITSGLALGIDAASHRGALNAQGLTIAVAGTGLDRVYPARHKDLATEIVNTGAMISEFPPGTSAKANHFPRRNRIISGLCQGLLVVEAAKQSGSLITARMALEQNREVFAIPGSIHNPLARGCNALIRNGAKLVETTQDILEELNQYYSQDEKLLSFTMESTLDQEQETLLNHVMFSPTSIDTLVENTGESVEVISSMLLILELQGYLEATAGGCYMRVK
ncbi:DNA-processing protein DprA [Methylobacter sp. S3L5C]|uniref:DNA-processing protein DprA n=1 Tax=Methylobacter sp. S3L5C TaxID=2839024 RepID=UPI001FAE68B7|nr:DNA-processing protein DprA [Methylobacter sp. S3L5C]UOA09189.1 DNA-processing protein DprA [Methylobacter sp. S3L5C]